MKKPDTYYLVLEVSNNADAGEAMVLMDENTQILSRHVDLKIAALSMAFEFEDRLKGNFTGILAYGEKPKGLTIGVLEDDCIRPLTDAENRIIYDTIESDKKLPQMPDFRSEKELLLSAADETFKILTQVYAYWRSDPEKIASIAEEALKKSSALRNNMSNFSPEQVKELTVEEMHRFARVVSLFSTVKDAIVEALKKTGES